MFICVFPLRTLHIEWFKIMLNSLAVLFVTSVSFFLCQDLTSSGQSTSSSSALSTPPPAGQSPAQPGSGVSGVQQVNGVTVGALASGMQTVTSTIPAVSAVGGIIGALPGNQLAINGIVGALNGVIQTPVTISQNPAPLTHTSVPPNAAHPMPAAALTNR